MDTAQEASIIFLLKDQFSNEVATNAASLVADNMKKKKFNLLAMVEALLQQPYILISRETYSRWI